MNKFLKGFVFAGRGIRSAIAGETNMKAHLIVTILVVIFGFLFGISVMEWIACLICMGLVISAEMMNTAIEKTVDYISTEMHPSAAKIKDVAAGAVLICALISATVGVIIFLPKVWIWATAIL